MKKQYNQPFVSVVMPVYNAAPYLVDAIESIMNQTYKNFEFIIVDDNSKDASWEILKAYAQKYKKIKIYKNTTNQKAAQTVGRAISKAKGDFIARMDADDISLPNRFEKQVAYLLANPKTVALGGQCILIDNIGRKIGEKSFPTSYNDIYKYIYHFCPVQQPSLMIAKNRLPKNFSFYDHGMSPVEDVELVFKFFPHGKVENMPDYLLKYRIHGRNSSLVNLKKSFFLTLISRIRGVLFYGYKPTFSGLTTTTIQAIVVLTLPTAVLMVLYKIMRKKIVYKALLASPFHKLSANIAALL